jgi:hypothetical protein
MEKDVKPEKINRLKLYITRGTGAILLLFLFYLSQ